MSLNFNLGKIHNNMKYLIEKNPTSYNLIYNIKCIELSTCTI